MAEHPTATRWNVIVVLLTTVTLLGAVTPAHATRRVGACLISVEVTYTSTGLSPVYTGTVGFEKVGSAPCQGVHEQPMTLTGTVSSFESTEPAAVTVSSCEVVVVEGGVFNIAFTGGFVNFSGGEFSFVGNVATATMVLTGSSGTTAFQGVASLVLDPVLSDSDEIVDCVGGATATLVYTGPLTFVETT